MAKKTTRKAPVRRLVDPLAGHVTAAQTQIDQLAPGGHQLDRIRAINRLRFLANAMLDVELERGREAGYSGGMLGGAAGMSGPGAQRRVNLRNAT